MGTLATAPGVLGAALTTYVTYVDVMDLLGCQKNSAYVTIREINKFARENDKFVYKQGKASKYIFADKFGIPMDVIDAVIERNKGQKVTAEREDKPKKKAPAPDGED